MLLRQATSHELHMREGENREHGGRGKVLVPGEARRGVHVSAGGEGECGFTGEDVCLWEADCWYVFLL